VQVDVEHVGQLAGGRQPFARSQVVAHDAATHLRGDLIGQRLGASGVHPEQHVCILL
jgi:hypothetical protein